MLTERQQQIIDSSLDLISEKGIQGLTIKNLAAKIGITEAAIYRHYKNKAQILSHILDSFKIGSVYESFNNENLPAFEKIERIFISHFQLFTKHPEIAAVIFSEELFRNETELKEKVKNTINTNNQNITQIITEGQKTGNVRDDIPPESIAVITMGSLRLLVKKWELNNYSFNLMEEGKKQINSLKILLQNN